MLNVGTANSLARVFVSLFSTAVLFSYRPTRSVVAGLDRVAADIQENENLQIFGNLDFSRKGNRASAGLSQLPLVRFFR